MSQVAFLVDDKFEDADLDAACAALRAAGHDVALVGIQASRAYTGVKGQVRIATDVALRDVTPDQFDALVIPGGSSPDRLRTDGDAVRFTRQLFLSGRPVAAVGHGGSLLIEADIVKDRQVTSWPSIRTDLVNAGARWVDRAVVEDGNLITSRSPSDLPHFCQAILRQMAYGIPGRPASRLLPETAAPRAEKG